MAPMIFSSCKYMPNDINCGLELGRKITQFFSECWICGYYVILHIKAFIQKYPKRIGRRYSYLENLTDDLMICWPFSPEGKPATLINRNIQWENSWYFILFVPSNELQLRECSEISTWMGTHTRDDFYTELLGASIHLSHLI